MYIIGEKKIFFCKLLISTEWTEFWMKMVSRGSQRDVVYLGRPMAIAPSFKSPNAGEGGCRVSANEYSQLCAWSPNKPWRFNSIFILWWQDFACRDLEKFELKSTIKNSKITAKLLMMIFTFFLQYWFFMLWLIPHEASLFPAPGACCCLPCSLTFKLIITWEKRVAWSEGGMPTWTLPLPPHPMVCWFCGRLIGPYAPVSRLSPQRWNSWTSVWRLESFAPRYSQSLLLADFKDILFSGFKSSYRKIRETRKLESSH